MNQTRIERWENRSEECLVLALEMKDEYCRKTLMNVSKAYEIMIKRAKENARRDQEIPKV